MSDLKEQKRYKIGQAAQLLELKPYILRYWEGEFDLLEPIRTSTGQRLYSEEHIKLISEIKRLLYDEGLTIEGARKRLESSDERTLLVEVYRELLDLKRILESRKQPDRE